LLILFSPFYKKIIRYYITTAVNLQDIFLLFHKFIFPGRKAVFFERFLKDKTSVERYFAFFQKNGADIYVDNPSRLLYNHNEGSD